MIGEDLLRILTTDIKTKQKKTKTTRQVLHILIPLVWEQLGN